MMGRIVAVLIIFLGLLFASLIPDAKTGLEIFWRANAIVGIAFWLGICWRRTNAFGAWMSSIAALGVDIIIHRFYPDTPLQWEYLYYLSAGFGMGILGSLVTRPPDQEKLRAFYKKLATPRNRKRLIPFPSPIITPALDFQ